MSANKVKNKKEILFHYIFGSVEKQSCCFVNVHHIRPYVLKHFSVNLSMQILNQKAGPSPPSFFFGFMVDIKLNLNPVESTVTSPVFVGQHALASIQWIHVVDEQLAISCGHQQPGKLLDSKISEYPSQLFWKSNSLQCNPTMRVSNWWKSLLSQGWKLKPVKSKSKFDLKYKHRMSGVR